MLDAVVDYLPSPLDVEAIKGVEYKNGHCWLPKNDKELINFVKKDKLVDGHGHKKPNFMEMSERKFRADKIDGLRPIKKYRF